MINKNPFSNNRAEYMEDVWRYYVPFGDLNMDNAKPLVIEGGRGTGKTMFFLCNSWRAMLSKHSQGSASPIKEYLLQKSIGLYYKVDPSFVAAMNENCRQQSEWETVFSTYLSSVLVKELVEFLLKARDEQVITRAYELQLARKYGQIFRGKVDTCISFEGMIADIECLLNDIEDVVNNPDLKECSFRKTRVGNGLSSFVDEMYKINDLNGVTVRIYIDEYESLVEWQQSLINTLIKKSDKRIIYNIGMKPMGMKTFSTLAAEEQLQETHDYKYVKLDDILLADDYKTMVLQICQKRLELFQEQEGISLNSVDIRTYLGESDISKEIQILEAKNRPKFYQKLREIIENKGATNKDLAEKELCENASLINARLHLALLMRSKYAVSVDELLECYQAWCNQEKNDKSKKYAEWMHTMKNGLVFLLAKECHVKKMYYGFETFLALSSGTIRYFLELCEQTINIALRDGFSWNQASCIDISIQSRAAYYIGNKKVMEIESYAEDGRVLRVFAQCLGELFQDLHRNSKSTVAEPEQNHFCTDSLTHSEILKKKISSAVQWSILLTTPSTKDKESIKTNMVDYHLNKIYAPFFGISCLRKRKISLSSAELEDMFSGDMSKAQNAVKGYLKNYWAKYSIEDASYGQLSFIEDERFNEC